MCSSPKPQKKVKGKGGKSGSLLSNMSPEARIRFAERANIAQERRHQIAIETKNKNVQLNDVSLARTNNKALPKKQETPRNLSYWLVNASLKEILVMLFLGKSKRI